jgi:hypothetical protein
VELTDVSAPGTSYNDTTGLTNGQQYSYRVCSYDTSTNQASGATGSQTPTDGTAPNDVTGLGITDPTTGNQLDLSWTNPGDSDFAGVKISRATGGTAPADCTVELADVASPGTSYNDTTGLTDNQGYSYRVCSYDTSTNQASGATGSGTPTDTTAPGNVTSFFIFDSGYDGELDLEWSNPNDTDFAGVKISRTTGTTPPADCSVELADVSAPTSSYIDTTGLTSDQAYAYRICSYDEVPNLSSGTTQLGLPDDDTPPGNVDNFFINSPPEGNQLDLSWTNPGDSDFAGVKISRATGSPPPADCSVELADVPSPGTSYIDTTGLTNGVGYTYRICSYDEIPNLSSGTIQAGTPLDTTAPGNVTGLNITDPTTGNQLDLSWSNPGDSDFAGVKISRATGGTAPADCTAELADVASPGTSYNDTTGLTDNQQYSYRVCSYDTSTNQASGATGSQNGPQHNRPNNR